MSPLALPVEYQFPFLLYLIQIMLSIVKITETDMIAYYVKETKA